MSGRQVVSPSTVASDSSAMGSHRSRMSTDPPGKKVIAGGVDDLEPVAARRPTTVRFTTRQVVLDDNDDDDQTRTTAEFRGRTGT